MDNIFFERLWRDVKYEDVYLNGHATMGKPHAGLTRYLAVYNGERLHEGLDYRALNVVYETGDGGGGGAMMVDKFGSVPDPRSPEPVQRLDAGSAGEHGAPSQTLPCREQSAMTATLIDG